MKIRFDKFIWCVRLAKTRSQASELITKGRFQLNGQSSKPSKEKKTGDIIGVQKNSAVFEFKIKQLLDKRLGATLVVEYI